MWEKGEPGMDSDGEDEGMEFNLSVERLLDGERGGVRGVNLGGRLRWLSPFLEDMAVISNVNVCINAKWLLCLQAPTHVSRVNTEAPPRHWFTTVWRLSGFTRIVNCSLLLFTRWTAMELKEFFFFFEYGYQGEMGSNFNRGAFFKMFFLGLHYFFGLPPLFLPKDAFKCGAASWRASTPAPFFFLFAN